MFGRSGQMFPRRTFHDAIYEEEYGSDNEDECCRCRGLSAILCWFLSVIILVGLAATVVLTVFFILRSRTMMVKSDVDVDVELYGKDQNLFDSKGGGGSSASNELLGSNEVTTASSNSPNKRKKSNVTKGSGRGPPDASKNDVDGDVNEEQNAISDSSEGHDHELAEDASVHHPRNHPNHHTHQQHNRNRLQPYSPIKTTTTPSTTTTTTTTEAPPAVAGEPSEEENANNNESSSEEETDAEQGNGEGSSLFNLFSGPRNPSYNTPSQTEDEEEDEEEDAEDDGNNEDDNANQQAENNNVNKNGVSSAEYPKSTRYQDNDPIQQVLFTESPKVTVTTPGPYGNRRNLQTTRMSTGRTSFTSPTTTTTAAPPSEESEEEEDEEEKNKEDDHEQVEENEEEDKEDGEKSSEEAKQEEASPTVTSAPQTTTSVFDDGTSSAKDSGSGGDGSQESGEKQLKQMLLDSIPPHGANKDDDTDGAAKDDEEGEESGGTDDDEMGGMSSSSEFNLSQKVRTTTTEEPTTTTVKPLKTRGKQEPPKQRGSGDTLSRLISRNFTRKTSSTTTETASSAETESQTERPASATTMGPAGHKYDYTMTPIQRNKLKTKSAESTEQDVSLPESTSTTAKPSSPKFTLKQRFRSTTTGRPSGGVVTPEPPSTAAPRTRGTTSAPASNEYGIKLGGKRGSVESPIDIIPSPDLSPKGQLKQQIQRLKEQQQKKLEQQKENSFEGVDLNSASSEDHSKTSSEQQFLDVLVGAEDHKTLVTKKTEDGIVTSAILPPWYDANGANSSISDVLATNGTTLSNTVAKVPTDGELEASAENTFGERTSDSIKKKSSEEKSPSDASSKEKQEVPSEFERLVNMFSKQEHSSEEVPAPPTTNRFGYRKQKVVIKKPGGSVNSRYIPQVPGRAGLYPSPPSSIETKSIEDKSISVDPSKASPEADGTVTNLETPPGDVGRTGVLPTAADVEAALASSGFYSEPINGPNKAAEHQNMENDRLGSEEIDSAEDESEGNPSHVIDVNIEEAGNNRAEIVIEPDTSAPVEDEEGDFVEDEDYTGYGENPPTLSMSGSAPNHNVMAPPEDYELRGSGVRKPTSSEEGLTAGDLEHSASVAVENNATLTTEAPNLLSTTVPVAVVRRPAYTREEIAKAVVKPSPESLSENTLNDEHIMHHQVPSAIGAPAGSVEEFEEEYEDDDNYDGGSAEQHTGGSSLEQWSSEKGGHAGGSQRWSSPDKAMDAVEAKKESLIQMSKPTLSEELTEPDEIAESAESIPHPTVQQNLQTNALDNQQQGDNTTVVFKAPQLVSFHENKLSFSPPTQLDGEYHSKDGWRPVINNGGSQEPTSSQVGSFEEEHDDDHEHQEQQQQLFQEIAPSQQQQHIVPVPTLQVKPPPTQQKWAQEQPQPQPQQQMIHPPHPQHPVKHNSVIPPPVPATVKFPDSEEDHEDRRHHGRHRPPRPGQFDRGKFMGPRPVPPPIVMRRRPPSGGPFPPPPGLSARQGPPPPHQQRPPTQPQMMQAAASQQSTQYVEQPPPPPGRPPRPPINRNFHTRQNPMRRFNFGGGGGPPQAQPRSGGNIKWPTEDGEVNRGDSNNNNSQQQQIEGAQSEVSISKRRRRRKRVPLLIPAA